MRTTTAVLVPVLLTLAAGCGGTKVAATGPTTAPPDAVRPPGTTGLPGLDWNNHRDEVTANYPGAAANGGGLGWTGIVEGRPARVQFVMDGDGLRQIDVTWDGVFESMPACGDVLHEVRPAIDARHGTGTEENLAVYWDTPTASITLACNPDEEGRATLIATHVQRTAE
jgi:hypothetical protein